jgi:hypothetical protein
MIEIVISYHQLIWAIVLWIVGSFLKGVGQGIGLDIRRKRTRLNDDLEKR